MHTELHSLILESVNPRLEVYLEKAGYKNQTFSDNEKLALLFTNFRIKNNQGVGLRLSRIGNIIANKVWESFTYEHIGKISHRAYITLDKNMIWPYYIGKKYVTFYSDNDASWFRLNGNDIAKYSEYL